ncbi:hypothetical protein Rs2_48826 [Raphanus sativus]|nr:hypothetical protein Rs2_48826 [Raphanus sativus]
MAIKPNQQWPVPKLKRINRILLQSSGSTLNLSLPGDQIDYVTNLGIFHWDAHPNFHLKRLCVLLTKARIRLIKEEIQWKIRSRRTRPRTDYSIYIYFCEYKELIKKTRHGPSLQSVKAMGL